jgi:hypothetical protein
VTALCYTLLHAECTPPVSPLGGEGDLSDSGRGGADYQLVWPRLLFQTEAAALLNNYSRLDDRDGRCELLLEDAFAGVAPRDDFLALEVSRKEDPIDSRKSFLIKLLRRAPFLKEAAVGRAPYWSERNRISRPGAISMAGAVREFVAIINNLDARGYFEKTFDKDCVDAPASADPSVLIEQEIGVADLWPLATARLVQDKDLFCDVIEVLHDFVARPRARRMHGYAGCGWHYSVFSLEAGQVLYRWHVNRVLDRSDLGLRLADEGEDAGRLVAVTDMARTELVTSMASRTDQATGEVVRHAIALFRSRSAGEHDKRSAAVTLAGVLEERRGLLKAELLSKDEGALFEIANRFAIRHRNDAQRSDYNFVFLDWLFWWYLATIELTDRILARKDATSSDAPSS